MKRNLLALFAVVLAIAFSAFTMRPVKEAKFASQWYIYTGTSFDANSEKNPSNYVLDTELEPCPSTPTKLCRLFINPNATGTSALEETDITALLNATTDPDSDGIFEVEVANIVDLKP